jgi:hypothetical protein
VVSQLLYVDIKILDEDKCISLLCSLPYSWDSLVVAIGSDVTTLKFDDVVSSLLSKEMKRKMKDSQSIDALYIIGRALDKNKNKSFSGRSKSRGRSKSPGKSLKKCWKCGKARHFKKDYRSKSVKREKGYDDVPSTEGKVSLEGGDVYLASSRTHANHDVWIINSGASFHMTSHMEWLCEYEKYNGGDIFLGDGLTTIMKGHRKVKL